MAIFRIRLKTFSVIKKVKNTVAWTYVISDFGTLLERFTKKKCQKQI